MMTSLMTDGLDVKVPKRSHARATARPVNAKSKTTERTKITLCLDSDAAQRLGVFAVMMGMERSSVVNQLIREHLRRFRIQDLDQQDRVKSNDLGPLEGSAS